MDGTPHADFFRYRYLQYQPSKGFGAVASAPAKQLRYAQPPNSGCQVYMPPLLRQPWSAVANDPETSLVITEGELKAACLSSVGVPCLGLGGVYSWRSAREGQAFLPTLEQFNWEGRTVNLCFDSDIATNPAVRMAASRLAYELTQRKAVVLVTELPATEEQAKVGLDDYALAYGMQSLMDLLANALPDPHNAALHEMNTEVAYLDSTVEVLRLEDGKCFNPRQFTDAAYVGRTYHVKTATGDGKETLVERRTAKEWLKWQHRTVVGKLEYLPGAPRITEEGYYNVWPGWAVQPSSKGTIAPWEDMIGTLLQGALPQEVHWLKSWLAYPLAHPGTKLYSAVLIWGQQQGTGKTLLGETMEYIYGQNFQAITNDDLSSGYTHWLVRKQFIAGDEISIDGNKRKSTDAMKNIITRTSATVNVKYQPQYTIKDCCNYYFTSNHSDAFFVEDSDRRFFIHEVKGSPQPQAVYNRYMHWLKHEGGAARLFYHLAEEVDLAQFNPTANPPTTASKVDMILAGKSDLDSWCLRLKAEPNTLLPSKYSLYTVHELLSLYDVNKRNLVSATGLGKALERAGFRKVANGFNNVMIDKVRCYTWVIRDSTGKLHNLTAGEAARHYEKERSGFVKQAGMTIITRGGAR